MDSAAERRVVARFGAPLRQELPRSQKLLPFSLKNRTFSLVSHPILDTRELHEDGVPRPAP